MSSNREPNIRITQVGENAPVTISQRIAQHWPLVIIALAAIAGLLVTIYLLAPKGGQGPSGEAALATSAPSAPLPYVIAPAAPSGPAATPPATVANPAALPPKVVSTPTPRAAARSVSSPAYSLRANVNPLEGGIVQGAGTFAKDSQATLQAIPNPGWAFQSWSGDASGADNPVAVVMDSAKTIIANFVPQTVALSLLPPQVQGLLVTVNGTVSPPESWVQLRVDWGDAKASTGTFPFSHKYDVSDTYTLKVTALNPQEQAVATSTIHISLSVQQGYYQVRAKGELRNFGTFGGSGGSGSLEIAGVEVAADHFRIYSIASFPEIYGYSLGTVWLDYSSLIREFVQDQYGNTYPAVRFGGDYDVYGNIAVQPHRKYSGWVEFRGKIPRGAQLSVHHKRLPEPVQFSLDK